MGGNRITTEELKQVLSADFDWVVERIAEAMNSAQPGRIIVDSEEPVRDANAEFCQQAYAQDKGTTSYIPGVARQRLRCSGVPELAQGDDRSGAHSPLTRAFYD